MDILRTMVDLNLLVFCLEGQADYVDAQGRRLVVCPGDIMLIPRGLAHSYRPTPGFSWSEIFIFFRGRVANVWWESGFLERGLNLLHAEPLLPYAQRLCQLFRPENGTSDEYLTGLQDFIAEIQAGATHPKPGAAWFQKAVRELEEGVLHQPDLRDMATRLGISYETFRKSFTLWAGTSPGHFRTAAVIRRACNLLNTTSHSLKQVAHELGFADEFHFSRTFSRHVGIPPRQYRRLGGKA